MKINNKTSNNFFGWHIKTHAKLTELALKKFPNLQPYEKALVLGSQATDILLKKTSFIDSTAHNFHGTIDEYPTMDAYEFYTEIYGKSLMNLQFGARWLAAFEAGEALHFLQDVALPLHSQKKYNSFLYILPHIKYEGIAKKHPELVDNIATKINITTPKYYFDNFEETHKKAANMPHPFAKENRRNWYASVKSSLENAYIATSHYLADISEKFKEIN